MPQASTQDFLEIDQIREGIVILKNKALRAIMMVSSLNFALKSDEEQAAIMAQFQEFLNSLDFSVQIVIQTRRLNIAGYLEQLKSLGAEQKNELLRAQMAEYAKFIKELIIGAPPAGRYGEIMSKNFFAVIPFTAAEIKVSAMTEEKFQMAKQQLWQRMEFVALGLRRCGLQAMPLTTPEIIELFWGLHHPQQAEVGYYPEVPPELAR